MSQNIDKIKSLTKICANCKQIFEKRCDKIVILQSSTRIFKKLAHRKHKVHLDKIKIESKMEI